MLPRIRISASYPYILVLRPRLARGGAQSQAVARRHLATETRCVSSLFFKVLVALPGLTDTRMTRRKGSR